MSSSFASAMRRALHSVRAGDPGTATRQIQEALAGRVPSRGTGAAAEAGETRFEGPTRAPEVRQALGDVVASLRKAGLARGPRTRKTPPLEVAPGAAFLARSFACSAGSRDYRLYVPACSPDERQGLVVMLHGCTQTPEDFAFGTGMNGVAEANRLLIAYPAQTAAANGSSCWNWFQPAHQGREGGEPAIIAGLTREVATEFGIAEARVFVAGLSAGGAMALVMAETHPELYAAAGVHSGLAYRAAHDAPSALAAMRGQGDPLDVTPRPGAKARPRVIVFHGSADPTVHPSNAERIVAASRASDPGTPLRTMPSGGDGSRAHTRAVVDGPDGRPALELWQIDGLGHAWSGGRSGGSFADPHGPDASAEMVRFFLEAPFAGGDA